MIPATEGAAPQPRPIPPRAGIGLRFPHHQAVLDCRPPVAWFEIHTEISRAAAPTGRYLEAVRRDYPISRHGVGLSLGSVDGLGPVHLERIGRFAARIEPALVSEHLASSTSDGVRLADLPLLPLTEETRRTDFIRAGLRPADG
jgi:uncharacterized protein